MKEIENLIVAKNSTRLELENISRNFEFLFEAIQSNVPMSFQRADELLDEFKQKLTIYKKELKSLEKNLRGTFGENKIPASISLELKISQGELSGMENFQVEIEADLKDAKEKIVKKETKDSFAFTLDDEGIKKTWFFSLMTEGYLKVLLELMKREDICQIKKCLSSMDETLDFKIYLSSRYPLEYRIDTKRKNK